MARPCSPAVISWLSPVASIIGMALVSLVWGWGRLGRVNDLLGHELDRLRLVDPIGADDAGAEFEGDVVTRQALSLGAAITRIDDLRRFAADALFGLPDATLVADAERQVIAANAAAQALLAERPWVLEGGGLADALNALEPLGRTLPGQLARRGRQRSSDRRPPGGRPGLPGPDRVPARGPRPGGRRGLDRPPGRHHTLTAAMRQRGAGVATADPRHALAPDLDPGPAGRHARSAVRRLRTPGSPTPAAPWPWPTGSCS